MSKDERSATKRELKSYIKKHKAVSVVYFVLRLAVILIMIPEIFNRNYNNVFLCILTLVLFMIPSFIEKKIKIEVPDLLQIIILLFIFAAEILGELREYYLTFPYWDAMLHTVNGFLCAAIGFALIDILNANEKISFNVSPILPQFALSASQ